MSNKGPRHRPVAWPAYRRAGQAWPSNPKQRAEEDSVPPCVILHDSMLMDRLTLRPLRETGMLLMGRVGDPGLSNTVRRFGRRFQRCVFRGRMAASIGSRQFKKRTNLGSSAVVPDPAVASTCYAQPRSSELFLKQLDLPQGSAPNFRLDPIRPTAPAQRLIKPGSRVHPKPSVVRLGYKAAVGPESHACTAFYPRTCPQRRRAYQLCRFSLTPAYEQSHALLAQARSSACSG